MVSLRVQYWDPFLFNLYINDLPSICNICNVESYVNNSKLYLSFLLRVASWCCSNGLLIDPSKTKFCIFGSGRMLAKTTIPTLIFLGKDLTVEDSVKDLGVILDKGLTFGRHIDSSTSDLMNKLLMIRRIKHLFDKSTLSVINSLVFSKSFFCSTVWSGTSKYNIDKLQLVQNFAGRILSGKRKFDHITPTMKQLKLLPVSDLLYIREASRSEVHRYHTMTDRDSLSLPKCRTSLAQQSLVFRGARV